MYNIKTSHSLISKFRRAICSCVRNPKGLIKRLWDSLASVISDKLFLKVKFRLYVGYWPNIDNPVSFNEKLQWLKLYDHHPEYTHMVDKIEVKNYVANKVGEKYIIKTLGYWDSVDEINWNLLPYKFVVKATNDSGGVVICKDKRNFDIEAAKLKLATSGGRDYSRINKEYPYEQVQHRFIAEEYMEDESGYELKDYKFFCSYGKPYFLFVATGRQDNDTRFDFYDIEFNHLPVLNGHPNADTWPVKPPNYDEMVKVAAKLSENIPHVRIDLYNINGAIYFGEMTFFHFSGMVPFEPIEWDYKFGQCITLPNK